MLAPLCAVIVTWTYSMLNCPPTWQGSMCPLAIRGKHLLLDVIYFRRVFLVSFAATTLNFFSSLLQTSMLNQCNMFYICIY
jgi:hypothetical protein